MDLKKLFMRSNKKRASLKEETIRQTKDSVDSQIDSVLLRYQNEASYEKEDIADLGLNEGYKMPNNWKLLLEQGEDEEAMPSGDDVMSIGDEMPRSTTPADPRDQKINIDDFAQKVANLYEHYDSLLNVQTVIINRATHMLERGYPADLVDEFLETLEREFGITLDGDKEEEVEQPPAGGSPGPIGVG